jgi:serine protease
MAFFPMAARRAAKAAAAALVFLIPLAGAAAPAAAPPAADEARVIVAFRAEAAALVEAPVLRGEGADVAARQAARRAAWLAARTGTALAAGRLVGPHGQVVRARGLSSEALAARLAAHPDIAWAVPDRVRRAAYLPNDPLFAAGPASGRGPDSGQWYLRTPDATIRSAVDAQGAWDLVRGNPSVVVAVLDSGIRAEHPDLAGVVLPGQDLISDVPVANDGGGRDGDATDPGDWITAAEAASGPLRGCTVDDSSWHGTMVAGIAGARADDATGIAGTAFGISILPVRVLGKCGGYDSDIVAGMYWAAGIDQPGLPGSRTPARVLNMSLGGGGPCDGAYPEAVAAITAAGSVIVASAGNSAGGAVSSPANCAGVVAVLALRHAGTKVGFSDLGPEITIAAPGGNCINIGPGEPCLYPIVAPRNSGLQGPVAGGSIWTDSFAPSVGTSFAAPIVAGTVALMLSARPEMLPWEVIDTLRRTARPFPTSGADNGPDDPTPVQQCRAPDGSDQLQCYCTTALCGAGMLDARAAVGAAQAATLVRIAATPAAPQAGQAVTVSSVSLSPAARSVIGWSWSIVDGGGATSGFTSAINGPSATFATGAAGTVTVQLAVTDDLGAVSTGAASVAIASPPPPPPPPSPPPSGGSGGGATSPAWLLGLALAVALLGAASPARASGPAGAAGATTAGGLIVQLKAAPTHRERAASAARGAAEAGRLREVLARAGLAPAAREGVAAAAGAALPAAGGRATPVAVAPAMASAQHLAFGRRLTAVEADRLRERLQRDPRVAWVEPDVRERRLQALPSDPLFAEQWWLQANGGGNADTLANRRRGNPGFVGAWQSGLPNATGGTAAVVAVLDTGITAHPDLTGRTLPGYDFVGDTTFSNDGTGRDADPADPGDWVDSSDLANAAFAGCVQEDSSWHGTVIAGQIAALVNNGEGGAGINQQGRVLPVRVAGKCGADLVDIVDAMRWAAGLAVAGVPANPNPARIVNISFGGSAACGSAYQAAVDELRAAGVVVVAAAGNEHGAVSRPASCSGVVGVVALNRDGFKSNYSNFGSALAASGIATVGGDDADGAWATLADGGLLSPWNNGTRGPVAPGSASFEGYAGLYGTSFSAPVVAGTLSLMLAVNPQLSATQMVEGLRRSARPHVASPVIGACSDANPGRCLCSTATCGAGILDALEALRFAAAPVGYVAPARSAEVIDNAEVRAAVALGPDRPANAPDDDDENRKGGGGAFALSWLAALALAAFMLRRPHRG